MASIAEKIAARIRQNQKGYFNTLGISITNRCTLNCSHCIRNSTPYSSHMPDGILSSIVNDIPKLKSLVNQIAITGGEPFLFKKGISKITEVAFNSGLKTSVVTSALWATSFATALKTIYTLPYVEKYSISTDIHHIHKVPLSKIRTAYEATKTANKLARICITVGYSNSSIEQELLSNIAEFANEDMRVQELMPWGRARTNCTGFKFYPIIPPIPCISTGPFLDENGTIYPCCGPLVSVPIAIPLREHLAQSLYESLYRIKINPLFHYIRIWGFRALFKRLSDAGFSSLLPINHLQATPCSTCASLFSIKEISSHLFQLINEPDFILEVVAGSVHIMEEKTLLDAYYPPFKKG
jgi:organic radical activating enzyme